MIHNQRGMGLVEVLVALLLLAVAILGFSAMQMSAVKATDESLMKTRALGVLRGAAEMMRANPDGINAFKTAINGALTSVSNTDTSSISITKDSCISNGTPATCTIKQMAVKDALTVKQYASDNELKVGMVTCPTIRTTTTNASGVKTTTSSIGQDRQCLIASWGDTDPILLDTPVANDVNKDRPCADEDGVYYVGEQCFIMEAY